VIGGGKTVKNRSGLKKGLAQDPLTTKKALKGEGQKKRFLPFKGFSGEGGQSLGSRERGSKTRKADLRGWVLKNSTKGQRGRTLRKMRKKGWKGLGVRNKGRFTSRNGPGCSLQKEKPEGNAKEREANSKKWGLFQILDDTAKTDQW